MAFTQNQKPYLAALTTIVFWSFTFPASKAVLPYFSPEQVAFLRYAVASLFYLMLFAMGQFPLPRWRDVPLIFLLGLVGVTFYQLLFVFGLARVSAGGAGMVVATNSVFVSLLAWIFLKEALSRRAWCGISVSVIGIAIITWGRVGGEFIGFMMITLAAFLIAIYFVFQKPFFARYSPLSMTSFTSIAGTLPLLYLLPGSVDAVMAAPPSALLVIVVMGVFSSGLGFLTWFYALSKLPAGIVSSFLFLQPILITIIAWFWLNETPALQTFIGGAVTLIGLALVLIQKKVAQP